MSITGLNVRKARLAKGWSQDKLAELAGVSQTTIDKIEQGKTLKSKYLPHIAKTLDISLGDIDPQFRAISENVKNVLLSHPNNYYESVQSLKSPIYGLEVTSRPYIFKIKNEPAHEIETPGILFGEPHNCVYICSDLMSPELEIGDAAFFEERRLIFPGMTGMFYGRNTDEGLRVIARLVIGMEDKWIVKCLKENIEFELPHSEWSVVDRLAVRYARR